MLEPQVLASALLGSGTTRFSVKVRPFIRSDPLAHKLSAIPSESIVSSLHLLSQCSLAR